LFEDKGPFRYHAIASNLERYRKRGDASENRIKDLKMGFGGEYMPCGTSSPRSRVREDSNTRNAAAPSKVCYQVHCE
jgi:hypothetical protein